MVGPNMGQPGSPSPGAAGHWPQGTPGSSESLPDIRKPDIQLLMQDLAQSRREVFEARREADRRVKDERDRSTWEQDRIRTEYGNKLRDAERENDALITALGRLRGENDSLRGEISVLKFIGTRNIVETQLRNPEPPKPQPVTAVPSTTIFKKPDIVPAPEPALGKPVSVDPGKMV